MANRPDPLRDVAVIVPAAGSGSRLGGAPKQFRDLGGRSLLYRTLEAICQVAEIGMVAVAAPEEAISEVEVELSAIGFDPIVVTAGGATRQDSVARGLACVPESMRIVLVHDAARPFVTVDEVHEVIAGVRAHGAAAAAIPVADTLRKVTGSNFGRTVSRDGVFRMQTPQGFRTDMFIDAHRWANENEWLGTDDVELVMARGHAVHLVRGRSSNFKITTAEDWRLAEGMLRAWDQGDLAND